MAGVATAQRNFESKPRSADRAKGDGDVGVPGEPGWRSRLEGGVDPNDLVGSIRDG